MLEGDESFRNKLTSVNIFVNDSALNTLRRLIRRLRFQALTYITKATLVHCALEGVPLPPKAKCVSQFSRVALG